MKVVVQKLINSGVITQKNVMQMDLHVVNKREEIGVLI